ncbi:MAG: hypothetical protein D8M59_03360 [Planctomycetes bacterium]|nr:hypothetical protein [Planctomycetota bacterium]
MTDLALLVAVADAACESEVTDSVHDRAEVVGTATQRQRAGTMDRVEKGWKRVGGVEMNGQGRIRTCEG